MKNGKLEAGDVVRVVDRRDFEEVLTQDFYEVSVYRLNFTNLQFVCLVGIATRFDPSRFRLADPLQAAIYHAHKTKI